MKKVDYRKELKHLYFPTPREVVAVEVPEMSFAMIDGEGDPNTSRDLQEAIEALYGLSYTAKFMIRKEGEVDYAVGPLEGLWWSENMAEFSIERKQDWFWTLMIVQPEYVTAEIFQRAAHELKTKKNPPALPRVRLESFQEGRAAQILHVGPFSEEGAAVAMVHAFIEQKGFKPSGKHHEIYLSDLRRTAPEKLKTVIRQPFAE